MLLQDIFRDAEEVVTASPDDTIHDAALKMKGENVGAVVVTNKSKVAGILTDRDIALALALGDATSETPVRQVMTRDVKTIWADQGIFNATQYMEGHKIRRLPVVDRDDKLVGMVTADDLFALLAREIFNVSRALEPSLQEKI